MTIEYIWMRNRARFKFYLCHLRNCPNPWFLLYTFPTIHLSKPNTRKSALTPAFSFPPALHMLTPITKNSAIEFPNNFTTQHVSHHLYCSCPGPTITSTKIITTPPPRSPFAYSGSSPIYSPHCMQIDFSSDQGTHLFKILEYLLFLNIKFYPTRSYRAYLLPQLSSHLDSSPSSSAQQTCFPTLKHSQLPPTLRPSHGLFTLAHYFSRLSFRYIVFDLDLSSRFVPTLLV